MLLNRTFAAVALDRKSLSQGSLDIEDRVRTNLFPWTGQFSPQLVEELLAAYAPRGGVILDPFVGSGTSLIEAVRQNLTAHGSDLNPAAVTLSQVFHLVNLDSAKRTDALNKLRDRLEEEISPTIKNYLTEHPLNSGAFRCFLSHVKQLLGNSDETEQSVLDRGWF